MATVISWTKTFSASDDGSVLTGSHLGNIQTDIESHYHSGGAATSYSRTFATANLVGGALSVTHSLGSEFVIVQVYDNNKKLIAPDDVTLSNTNTCTIDMTSYTGSAIAGWGVKIIA